MFDETEKSLISSILDQIIPASKDGKIPSAGVIGVADFIELEIKKNVSLLPRMKRGLKRVSEIAKAQDAKFDALSSTTKVSILQQVEREDAEFFKTLITQTYMGYYSRPDIRALLNLSPNPVHPDGYYVDPESSELMSKLTGPVIERGQCFRAC